MRILSQLITVLLGLVRESATAGYVWWVTRRRPQTD